MITLEGERENGLPCYIDVCPRWKILDPENKHPLTRRPRVIGEVALYPETNDWVLGPIVRAYRDTKCALENGGVPGSIFEIPEEGRPLDTSTIYNNPDYKRRLDKFYSSLPTGDALRRIKSQEQADAYEARAGRILGPCILKYLERKYPEVNKDPTLRVAIDNVLMETRYDIDAAAAARKDHLLSKDSDPVRRIGWAIRKKTIATIGLMTAAMYSDERYQLHPKRTSIARARQLFLDSIQAALTLNCRSYRLVKILADFSLN